RAEGVCAAIRAKIPKADVEPVAAGSGEEMKVALAGRALVVAAGAAGVVLVPKTVRAAASELKVAIDLNAVPPVGVEGVEVHDKAALHDGVVCYGVIGVGN